MKYPLNSLKTMLMLTSLILINTVNAANLTASEDDLAGLTSFITEYQTALKQGNSAWVINHDPQHIADATFAGQNYTIYKQNVLGSVPAKIAAAVIDEGAMHCAIKLGEITLAIVNHQIAKQKKPEAIQKVYIQQAGRWWVTDNQAMKKTLSSFREDMFKAINTPDVFAQLQVNACYNQLNR